MAQNLTVVVGDSSKNNDAAATAATAAADTAVINFKPKDTNGWKDYKKLKTYLILKEQQNEKVNALGTSRRCECYKLKDFYS